MVLATSGVKFHFHWLVPKKSAVQLDQMCSEPTLTHGSGPALPSAIQ